MLESPLFLREQHSATVVSAKQVFYSFCNYLAPKGDLRVRPMADERRPCRVGVRGDLGWNGGDRTGAHAWLPRRDMPPDTRCGRRPELLDFLAGIRVFIMRE